MSANKGEILNLRVNVRGWGINTWGRGQYRGGGGGGGLNIQGGYIGGRFIFVILKFYSQIQASSRMNQFFLE